MASIFSGWFNSTPPVNQPVVHQGSSFFRDTIVATALSAIALVSATAFDRTNPALAALLRCTAGGVGLIWLFKRCCCCGSNPGQQTVNSPTMHVPIQTHNPHQGNWVLPFHNAARFMNGFFGSHSSHHHHVIPAKVHHHGLPNAHIIQPSHPTHFSQPVLQHPVIQAPLTHSTFPHTIFPAPVNQPTIQHPVIQAPVTRSSFPDVSVIQPTIQHPVIQAPASGKSMIPAALTKVHAPQPSSSSFIPAERNPGAASNFIAAKKNPGAASNDFPVTRPAAAKPGAFPNVIKV